MRILFAEDDRDLSNAVKTLLERNGYQVDAVYDGLDAVDYAAAEAYDGMILDWMMPGSTAWKPCAGSANRASPFRA